MHIVVALQLAITAYVGGIDSLDLRQIRHDMMEASVPENAARDNYQSDESLQMFIEMVKV